MMLVFAALAACAASLLTFFSGFGLVTVLTPLFIALFPVETAVMAVAVVHLANNLLKAGLVGRHADVGVALRFGLPAAIGSAVGAVALGWLAVGPGGWAWSWEGLEGTVRPATTVLGVMMVAFAALELRPPKELGKRGLVAGGLLSGFFGGLTGHQGALRSAFLVRAGLEPKAFVATGVAIALGVDVVRLAVYGGTFDFAALGAAWPLLASAVGGAAVGSIAGARLLHRLTVKGLQRIVAVLLLITGIATAAGVMG
jgi:uncharacterized membrane protein YfcA